VPYQADTRGFHTRSIARAIAAGKLAWYKAQPAGDRTQPAVPKSEAEAAVLDAWHKRPVPA